MVRGWLEAVQADPTAIRPKDPNVVLRNALEAALTNYSRKKDNCLDVAPGEFLEDDGDYYAVATVPQSTKHRKEISTWDAVLRVASGEARRIPKNTYEWKALRLALYPPEEDKQGDGDE
jgi:hypothetical protein